MAGQLDCPFVFSHTSMELSSMVYPIVLNSQHKRIGIICQRVLLTPNSMLQTHTITENWFAGVFNKKVRCMTKLS